MHCGSFVTLRHPSRGIRVGHLVLCLQSVFLDHRGRLFTPCAFSFGFFACVVCGVILFGVKNREGALATIFVVFIIPLYQHNFTFEFNRICLNHLGEKPTILLAKRVANYICLVFVTDMRRVGDF